MEAASGSAVRTENTIKGDVLFVKISSGGDVSLDVAIKNLTVRASSGSDTKLQGKVKTLNVAASNSSDVKANYLESKICHATASSDSNITLKVSDEFYGKAGIGSNIYYYGNPATVDTNESNGGNIHHNK